MLYKIEIRSLYLRGAGARPAGFAKPHRPNTLVLPFLPNTPAINQLLIINYKASYTFTSNILIQLY